MDAQQVFDTLFQKMSISPRLGGPLAATDKMIAPDFESYPEEFDYLARCLYKFGPQMSGYRLVDLNCSGWLPAIVYILATDRVVHDQMSYDLTWMKLPLELMNKSMSEVACELGIRILVLGPDPTQIRLIDGLIRLKDDDTSSLPYAVLYHGYDNLWYPLEHLDHRSCHLCYENNDPFLKNLLESKIYQGNTINSDNVNQTS